MRILVIGSGAREHTIAWKLAQSPRVAAMFAAPGNAGTAEIATNLLVDAGDIEALAAAVKDNRIDLAVIGPEAPLAAGIVDRFQALGIPVFGPSQRAAEIESSKVFAKELMIANGIPCPGSVAFSDHVAAADYVRRQSPPIVVKAEGLAAGKGVVVGHGPADHAGILRRAAGIVVQVLVRDIESLRPRRAGAERQPLHIVR